MKITEHHPKSIKIKKKQDFLKSITINKNNEKSINQ